MAGTTPGKLPTKLDHFFRITRALDQLDYAFKRPIPRCPDGARKYWDELQKRKDELDAALRDYGLRP